jgi:hypothetical protein
MLNRLNQRYEQLANLSGDFSEAGVMSGKEPEEELYLNENLVTHRLKVFFGLDKSCSRNS